MKTSDDDDDTFDERGVMRPGRTFHVSAHLMDARTRCDVVDALGNPAGSRNGFAFPVPGSEAARQQEINEAIRATHLAMYLGNLKSSGVTREEYVRQLNDAWRNP